MPVGIVDDTYRKYRSLVGELGQAAANALFPNDIEYYALTLELVNSKGFTVDSLFFPVMPKEIQETEMSLVNIKKTAGGIVSLNTNSFVPKEISISGNFGRSFKLLLGGNLLNFRALQFSTQDGAFSKEGIQNLLSIKKAVFDPRIKNGYGCMRILSSILEKASSTDQFGKPHTLYLYNPALGNNYVVEPINKNISLEESENLIHQYNFALKAIAPLEGLASFDPLSLASNLAIGAIQRQTNVSLSNTKLALS